MPDTLVPPEVFTYPEIKEAIMQLHNGGDAPYIIEALYNPLSEDEMTENYDVRRIDVLATLNIMKIDDEYGTCGNCYEPRALYKYSMIHRNNTIHGWYRQYYNITEHNSDYSLYNSNNPMCKVCTRSRIMEVDLYEFNGHVSRNTYSILLPDSIFPEPITVLNNCDACSATMLPSGARNLGHQEVEATGHDNALHIVHGNCAWTCHECAEKYVYRGTYAAERNLLNNQWHCIKCFDTENTDYSQCEACSTYYSDDLIYSDYYGDYRCSQCYNEYIECQDCGYEYSEDDGHSCDNDDEGSSYIYNYSYKPSPRFFGDDRVYMGIELEVEASQRRSNLHEGAEYVATFADHGSRLYLKSDGSLSYGFEVVTHPHSLKEYHSLDWKWLDKLRSMGYRSWDASSCGIHVHVGLTAFVNDNHQIRFTKFIYDNERQVKRIAGRTSSYATFNDKGKAIPKIKNKSHDMNRYSAVNVQNEHTLEVRVFKGSLRKERVLSAIEFVHAVTEYTRTLEIVPKLKPFSWARFVAYVSANSETYPNLFIIINETFESDTTTNDQEND